MSDFLGEYADNDTDLNGKYIVWAPKATMPPKYVYGSRPDAIKVAYQMAAKNPQMRFAVCKIVGVAETTSVKFESFED